MTFLKELVYELQSEKKELYKLLDQQQQLTLQANQQIEKLQEQLQLSYTKNSSEEDSTSDMKEVDQAPTNEKKWWQFWQ